MTCEEITALLTLAPLVRGDGRADEDEPALDEAEAARLEEHITGCEACREAASALTSAYRGLDEAIEERTSMEPMTTDLRERTLAAVRDTLAHDAEPAPKKDVPAAPEPGPDPRAVDAIGKKIALACSYCHDRATRDEVVFCASCLAPHHRECFETHGTCTLPGCGESRTVRPADTPQAPPRRSRRWLAFPLLAGVLGAGGIAAVALTRRLVEAPVQLAPPPTPPPREQTPFVEVPVAPPEAVPDPTVKLELGLTAVDAPARNDAINIDVVVDDVDLALVMERIGARVGTNILVDPNVQETVSVNLREIPWRAAVDLIARMTRCEVEERSGGILVLTQPPKVTIQFTDANVRTILQLLAAYSGKNMIVGRDVTGTLTVDLQDLHWWRALETVAENRKLHLVRCRDAVIVTATPLDPAIIAGLPLEVPTAPARDPGPRLWLDAVNADLVEVAERLGRLVGSIVLVDPRVDERVTLSLRDLPFRDALDAVARGSSCRVEERPGGVLLLTPLPSGSLAAAACPVKPLLQLLAAGEGWNAVIDGNIQAHVTVALENVDFYEAAIMTLAPLGIAASANERDEVFSFTAVTPAVAPATVEVAPGEDARLSALIGEVARLARAVNGATEPAKRAALATELEARQADLRTLLAPASPRPTARTKAQVDQAVEDALDALERAGSSSADVSAVKAACLAALDRYDEAVELDPTSMMRHDWSERLFGKGDGAVLVEVGLRTAQIEAKLQALQAALDARRWDDTVALHSHAREIVRKLRHLAPAGIAEPFATRLEELRSRARDLERVEAHEKRVRVQAILRSDTLQAAVINGVVYGAGDTLLDENGNTTEGDARITVTKIEDGAVTLEVKGTPFTRGLGSD